MANMKINLAVIFGGKSVEHEISVITALQAIRSIDREKYEVIPVYLTKGEEFYTGEPLFEIENFRDIPALLKGCERVSFARRDGAVYIDGEKKGLKKPLCVNVDVAFPIVHGTNVEDGTMAGYFHLLGLPYCGCDVTSSALGMDKLASKAVLATKGIPVLTATDFYTSEWSENRQAVIDRIESEHRYPLIVKPVNLGSSVGVYRSENRESLIKDIDNCCALCERVMVENCVENLREINCAVLGDVYEAVASPCEEPLGKDEILSYNDKYRSGGKGMSGLTRRLPADIGEQMTEQIRGYAVDTFRALGCCGVARVDFLTDRVSGEIYVNEINTIPGSLSFYLWEAAGKSYKQLLDDIISLGLKRERLQQNINYSFDVNILADFSFGGSKGKMSK